VLRRTDQPTATRQGGVLHRLYDRFGHLLHELGKFGVVGGVAYLVDFTLFWTAEQRLHMTYAPAAVISTTVAASVAFVGNRFWTWRHRPRTGLGREYLLFFLFNAIGLAINLAVLWFSHDILGAVWPWFHSVTADVLAKQIVGMTLGTAFRFWAYRRYVFPHDPLDAAGRLAQETEEEHAGEASGVPAAPRPDGPAVDPTGA
jgi:putative flippase GtrA